MHRVAAGDPLAAILSIEGRALRGMSGRVSRRLPGAQQELQRHNGGELVQHFVVGAASG